MFGNHSGPSLIVERLQLLFCSRYRALVWNLCRCCWDNKILVGYLRAVHKSYALWINAFSTRSLLSLSLAKAKERLQVRCIWLGLRLWCDGFSWTCWFLVSWLECWCYMAWPSSFPNAPQGFACTPSFRKKTTRWMWWLQSVPPGACQHDQHQWDHFLTGKGRDGIHLCFQPTSWSVGS